MRRNFEIHISSLALSEFSVYFASDTPEHVAAKHQQILRPRMRFFAELLKDDLRLAPTHGPLIHKLGGSVVGMPASSYPLWLETARKMWKALAAAEPIPSDIASCVDGTAAYVSETGADFTRTSQAAASMGDVSEEEMRRARPLGALLPDILDFIHLPPPITPAVRFDAYSRLRDLHAERAYSRSSGRMTPHTPNHAIDLNLLQHLADGLVVVTRDYELIEEVDACGSPQAPWVRTVGELLAGRIPTGPPFGYHAQRAKSKHRVRTRDSLRRLEQQGETLARSESDLQASVPLDADGRR